MNKWTKTKISMSGIAIIGILHGYSRHRQWQWRIMCKLLWLDALPVTHAEWKHRRMNIVSINYKENWLQHLWWSCSTCTSLTQRSYWQTSTLFVCDFNISLLLCHLANYLCCCPWGKSLSLRILEDQFSSPCPCPWTKSSCPCPRKFKSSKICAGVSAGVAMT